MPERGSDHAFGARFETLPAIVAEKIFALDFRGALESVWELVNAPNRAIDDRKPWTLFKKSGTPTWMRCLRLRGLLARGAARTGDARTRPRIGSNRAAVVDADGRRPRGGPRAGTQTKPARRFPRIELTPA